MIQEAIFSKLSGTAGLIALVPATQIYYRMLKQSTAYPAIRYSNVAAPREHANSAEPGIVHGWYQFDVFDTDPDGVRNVCEQLRLAISRWRALNVQSVAQIFDTFIDNEIEHDPELVDNELVYRKTLEATIHYTE